MRKTFSKNRFLGGLLGLAIVGALVTPLWLLHRGAQVRVLPAPRAAALQPLADLARWAMAHPEQAEWPATIAQRHFRRVSAEALIITGYYRGERQFSLSAAGGTFGSMVRRLIPRLQKDSAIQGLAPADKARMALRYDLVAGKNPVNRGLALWYGESFAPGLDGAAGKLGDEIYYVAPSILEDQAAFAGAYFLGQNGFPLAADPATIERALSLAAGPGHGFPVEFGAVYRLRTHAYLQWPGRQLEALWAGRTPRPAVNAERLRQAAVAGGHWLIRQLHPDNRFTYEYDPVLDAPVNVEEYNLPRHAGTVYSLYLLAGRTGQPEILQAADRALSYVARFLRQPKGAPGRAFTNYHVAKLGSSALALAAAVHARRAHSTYPELEQMITDLADFIIAQELPNGDFTHHYDIKAGRPAAGRVIYYSGEAAFALAALARDTRLPRYSEAAEKAIDFMTATNRYFLREYFPITDSWICMAVGEFAHVKPKEQHLGYAKMVAHSYADVQLTPADTVRFKHLFGGFSPAVPYPPNQTGTSSNLEGMISTLEALRIAGQKDERLEDATRLGLRFLLWAQFRERDAYRFAAPATVDGGIGAHWGSYNMRVDFVQHMASALIRGAGLLAGRD